MKAYSFAIFLSFRMCQSMIGKKILARLYYKLICLSVILRNFFYLFQLYSENATMSNFKYCKFYNCLLQSYSIFSFLFYCEFLTIIYSFVIIINHIVVHFILLNIMFKFISFRKFDLKQHNMYFHFWAKRSDFVKLFQ